MYRVVVYGKSNVPQFIHAKGLAYGDARDMVFTLRKNGVDAHLEWDR